MALFGTLPRATVIVWVVIVYSLAMGYFGALLGLPQWMLELTPFGHVPMLPAVPMAWAPLAILTALTVALTAAGVAGFRRRDLLSPA